MKCNISITSEKVMRTINRKVLIWTFYNLFFFNLRKSPIISLNGTNCVLFKLANCVLSSKTQGNIYIYFFKNLNKLIVASIAGNNIIGFKMG